MKKPLPHPSPDNRALRQSKLSVIEKLIEHGSMSRSDLAESLHLSRPALTALSRELIDLGLIHETAVEHDNKRQGRPSILLALNPAYGYFVGVCITDHPPVLMLCDVNGNVLGHHAIAATRKPEAVAKAIQEGIHHFLVARQIPRKDILGIGMAVSGMVDREHGVCRLSNELDWRDVPIAAIVREATGIPAFLENDANAAAMGEKLFGNARTEKNFTVITVDRAIGCGHYIHGGLYRGHDGGAGEIGHTTIDLNGLPCLCGKKGCLDTVAGSKAILEAAQEKGIAVQTVEEIEALAAAGNAEAITILYRAGQALGLAVAHLIQNNNPRMVIFALSENIAGGVFIAATQQTIESNVLPRFLPTTKILFQRMDNNFWDRGAASIAAYEYFRYQASM